MKNGKRIIELQEQLLNSSEYQRIGQIKHLSYTLQIFSINSRHLKRKLENAHNYRVAIRLGGNQYLFKMYFLDMMCLLHNFVAASLTLIDHARRLHKTYLNHPEFKDYNREIKARFATDHLCQFVKNLRSYAQHYELPLIGSKMSVVPNISMQHTMFLNRDKLLQWKHWTAHARVFLETSNKEIDLYEIVVEYETKIQDFYNWYYQKLREIHETDMSYVEAKQAEMRQIEGLGLPKHLESELRRNQKSQPPENMFNGYVDPETLYKLSRSDTGAVERSRILLKYVSKYSTVSKALQERVIAAFIEYYDTGHGGS